MWPRRLLSDGQVVGRVLRGRTDDYSLLIERYGNAVHAVAYAQVATHADAEDAAQEAFLKAYTSLHTLRDRNRFGAWIITIARNCAIAMLRARGRTARPSDEREPATPPRDFEGEELRALLRQKVMELELGPREVLLLHYYGGKSVGEMASLLGITTEASKKRLQRARETLSTQLAGEIDRWLGTAEASDTRNRKIMSAVIVVVPEWNRAAATAATGGVAGGLLGGTALKAGLAALVAGFVLLPAVQWQLTSRAGRDVETGQPALLADVRSPLPSDAAVSEASPEISAPVADVEENAVEQATDTVAGAAIAGRVYNAASGEGLGGAQVIIEDETDPDRGANVDTNAQGEFRASGLSGGTYVVRCVQEVYPPSLSTWRRTVTVGTDEPVRVDFPLAPGIRVAGRVVDGDGNPVNEARVGAMIASNQTAHATTDARGAFTVFVPQAGPDLRLGARTDTHESEVLGPIVLDQKGMDDVVLTLAVARNAGFSGVVVDTAGKPVAGATIHPQRGDADYMLSSYHAKTQPDGTFALTSLAPGDYTIAVSPPGVDMWSSNDDVAELHLRDAEHKIRVRLVLGGGKSGASIAGRVVDTDGRGIAKAEITTGNESAFTEDDGHFKLTLLEPGEYVLSVRGVSYGKGNYTPIHSEAIATGTEDVLLVLEREGRVQGRVLDARNGRPIREFEVFLRWPGGMERITEDVFINGETYQSQEGRFSRKSYSGVVTLTAKAKGYASAMVNAAVEEDTAAEVELRLTPSATIAGRVVDPAGAPVEGVRVYYGSVPHESERDQRVMATTDGDGAFTLDSIDPAMRTISVYHSNYAPAWGAAEDGVIVTLAAGGTLTGVVRMNGDALKGVDVDFHYPAEVMMPHRAVRTGGDGKFEFQHVLSGSVQIEILRIEPRAYSTRAEVGDGEVTDVVIDIPPASCSVEGIVASEGVPVAGVALNLEVANEAGAERRDVETGAGGEYRFEGLPAGSVRIVARVDTADGGQIARSGIDSFILGDGEVARRDIELGGVCGISGSVRGVERYQAAVVWLFHGELAADEGGFQAFFQKNYDVLAGSAEVVGGAYSFDHLAPGAYTAIAVGIPSGYDPYVDVLAFAAATVVVDGSAPGRADFELP